MGSSPTASIMEKASKEPRSDYEKTLFAYENLTIGDVKKALEKIDPKIVGFLKEGPVNYRYDCAVCIAFGGASNKPPDISKLSDDEMVVWIYHELPKMSMKRGDQVFYGPFADQIYERCIETYKAAGWTGEPEPPNATARIRYG